MVHRLKKVWRQPEAVRSPAFPWIQSSPSNCISRFFTHPPILNPPSPEFHGTHAYVYVCYVVHVCMRVCVQACVCASMYACGILVLNNAVQERGATLWDVRAVTFNHLNAVHHRANRDAERAAGAILRDFWNVCLLVKGDGLVARVVTGHVTLAAVDAQVWVDNSDHLLALRQLVPPSNLAKGSANHLVDRRYRQG